MTASHIVARVTHSLTRRLTAGDELRFAKRNASSIALLGGII